MTNEMDIGAVVEAYSIVTTTRAKYFGKVNVKDGRTAISSAYEIPEGVVDPQAVAKGYIRGDLYGENRSVELSNALVESVTEAKDETRILLTLQALLPEAKKRALGVMTYKALEDLLQSK